ncbi:MAG: porin family protein [Prevotella sp.]
MNMRNLFVAIVTLFAVEASAQGRAGQLSLIPRVGFSITQLTNDYIYFGDGQTIGKRWKPAFEAGLDVEYMIFSRLSVTAGAKYSLQGTKYKDFHMAGEENNGIVRLAQFSRSNVDLHYLQVPLMLHAYITKGFSIGAGIQFGRLLSARESHNYMICDYNNQTNKIEKYYNYNEATGSVVEVGDDDDRYLKYRKTVTDNYKRSDVTIPLSISYESDDVILDLRYNLGLNDISNMVDKMRNSVITFSIGYRIPLLR